MLQSIGLQRVGYNLVTEQQIKISIVCFCFYKNRKSHPKIHKNFKGLTPTGQNDQKQTNKA